MKLTATAYSWIRSTLRLPIHPPVSLHQTKLLKCEWHVPGAADGAVIWLLLSQSLHTEWILKPTHWIFGGCKIGLNTKTFLARKLSHRDIMPIFFQYSHCKDLRYELIIKNVGIFQVSFFQVHGCHPLHFYSGSEVAAWSDILIDGDIASKLA